MEIVAPGLIVIDCFFDSLKPMLVSPVIVSSHFVRFLFHCLWFLHALKSSLAILVFALLNIKAVSFLIPQSRLFLLHPIANILFCETKVFLAFLLGLQFKASIFPFLYPFWRSSFLRYILQLGKLWHLKYYIISISLHFSLPLIVPPKE